MKKELEYFSEEFLEDLGTKSEGFQNEFRMIMQKIDSYFYEEDESLREGLREYMENGISFSGSGHLLYSFEELVPTDKGRLEFVLAVLNGICSELSNEDEDTSDALKEASHFLIGIRGPEEYINSDFSTLIRDIICTARKDIPDILVVTNTPKEGLPNGFFAAAIK